MRKKVQLGLKESIFSPKEWQLQKAYSFLLNCRMGGRGGGDLIATFGGKNPPVHLIIIRE